MAPSWGDSEEPGFSPPAPLSIVIDGDRTIGVRMLQTAKNALYQLRALGQSGSALQKSVISLPEGTITVSWVGDSPKAIIKVGAGAAAGETEEVRYPPRILSGVIRTGTITGEEIHSFRPTPECAAVDLENPELALAWSPSKQLAVEHPVRLDGPAITPGLYSGRMRILVQILLGMGKTWGSREIRNISERTSTIEDDPHDEVVVRYNYRWAHTHGVHTASDGSVWIVEIADGVGVHAMRLPRFKGQVAADDKHSARRLCRDMFRGIPNGKGFPDDMDAAIGAGQVIQLMSADELAPFYVGTHGVAESLGWSFNKLGTEAHSVCISDGGVSAAHYVIHISLSGARLSLVSDGALYQVKGAGDAGLVEPSHFFAWGNTGFERVVHGGPEIQQEEGAEDPPPTTLWVGYYDDILRVLRVWFTLDPRYSREGAYWYHIDGVMDGQTRWEAPTSSVSTITRHDLYEWSVPRILEGSTRSYIRPDLNPAPEDPSFSWNDYTYTLGPVHGFYTGDPHTFEIDKHTVTVTKPASYWAWTVEGDRSTVSVAGQNVSYTNLSVTYLTYSGIEGSIGGTYPPTDEFEAVYVTEQEAEAWADEQIALMEYGGMGMSKSYLPYPTDLAGPFSLYGWYYDESKVVTVPLDTFFQAGAQAIRYGEVTDVMVVAAGVSDREEVTQTMVGSWFLRSTVSPMDNNPIYVEVSPPDVMLPSGMAYSRFLMSADFFVKDVAAAFGPSRSATGMNGGIVKYGWDVYNNREGDGEIFTVGDLFAGEPEGSDALYIFVGCLNYPYDRDVTYPGPGGGGGTAHWEGGIFGQSLTVGGVGFLITGSGTEELMIGFIQQPHGPVLARATGTRTEVVAELIAAVEALIADGAITP